MPWIKRLFLVFLISFLGIAVHASESDIFVVYLKYNGTDVGLNGFNIRAGFPYSDPSNPSDAFRADIVDPEGNVLYSTNFSMGLMLYTDPPTFLNETEHILRIPYFKTARKIIIYHKDMQKLEVDLDGFSDNSVPAVQRNIEIESKQEFQQLRKEEVDQRPLVVAGFFAALVIALLLIRLRNKT